MPSLEFRKRLAGTERIEGGHNDIDVMDMTGLSRIRGDSQFDFVVC